MKTGSNFILLWYVTSYPGVICYTDYSSPHWTDRVYFWILNAIPLSILLPVPHYFYYCYLVVSFKIGKCESLNFVSFFRIISAILDYLNSHMNFGVSLSIYVEKKSRRDFDRDRDESVGQFEHWEYRHLNVKSSDPGTWNIFPFV